MFLSKCQHGISSVLGRQWCSLHTRKYTHTNTSSEEAHTLTSRHPDIHNLYGDKYTSTHFFMQIDKHWNRDAHTHTQKSWPQSISQPELPVSRGRTNSLYIFGVRLSFFLPSSSPLFFSLHPHPPLISLSNSLISLSSPSASLFHSDILSASLLPLWCLSFSPHSFLPPPLLFSSILLHFAHLLVQPHILSTLFSILFSALLPLPSWCYPNHFFPFLQAFG